jgi:hypothetical protein
MEAMRYTTTAAAAAPPNANQMYPPREETPKR